MPQNRLRLDFSLQTSTERLDFLNKYLPTLNFTPNEHETETLSDYLLWGKDPKTGLNSQQEGISLKEWAPTSNVESIDGLLDVPGFQETRLKNLGTTQYRAKRVVFDREAALRKADSNLKPLLEDLFDEIDRTELTINFYELRVGKRKKPPRPSLLNRFSQNDLAHFESRAAQISGRTYLQLRHYLVELRTEQYSYKDLIQESVALRADTNIQVQSDFRFDEDVEVRPLGLHDGTPLSQKIWSWPLHPNDFSEEELKQVNRLVWKKPDNAKNQLDFTNPEHILALYRNYEELKDSLEEDPNQIYGSAAAIIRTLQFYESMAKLSDLQRELLHMKIEQKSNLEIKDYINKKYGTSYNENYISTIYRQKILGTIAEAAQLHRTAVENVFYPEEFKVCKECGRPLLRVPEFFMRQKKSSDGFAPRCKDCQKKAREKKKEDGKRS